MLPMTMVRREAPRIVGLRPHESAVDAPIADPSGAPNDITSELPSDDAMLRPAWTKKVGSHVMNPKINVLTTINVVAPTIMRGSSRGLSSTPKPRDGIAGEEITGGLRG